MVNVGRNIYKFRLNNFACVVSVDAYRRSGGGKLAACKTKGCSQQFNSNH